VAELVRDDTLQLVALEPSDGAARHRNGRIGRRVAGRERIDAVFVLEHVYLGHRDARGNRHFLDHVVQPLESDVARAAFDASAAEGARDDGAAGAQRQRLEQAGAAHDREDDDRGEDERTDRRRAFARGA
jgi:hypothetical protein